MTDPFAELDDAFTTSFIRAFNACQEAADGDLPETEEQFAYSAWEGACARAVKIGTNWSQERILIALLIAREEAENIATGGYIVGGERANPELAGAARMIKTTLERVLKEMKVRDHPRLARFVTYHLGGADAKG